MSPIQELMARSHPVRLLLTGAAAGAEVTAGDLDYAAGTARPGQAERVRAELAERVARIRELRSRGERGPARRLAREAAEALSESVEPRPARHGVFDDPDRGATPGQLAGRIPRR